MPEEECLQDPKDGLGEASELAIYVFLPSQHTPCSDAPACSSKPNRLGYVYGTPQEGVSSTSRGEHEGLASGNSNTERK